MSRRRGTASLAVLGLAAGTLSAVPTASAGHAAVTIQVGAQLGGRHLPAESMRYGGPDTITVHQGDRITFDFRGFHTATMLPTGAGPDDWLMENATTTGPFGFAETDPDDGPNEFKDNFDSVLTPSQADCGGSGQTPCTYNGDAVVNSGIPPGDLPTSFTVTVNSQPGTTFWVVCLIHHHMRKRIRVVADPAAATPQATVDSVTRAQLARDLDWAQATHEKYSDRRTSHETASGRRVWDAWAGVDSRFVSLYAFYPTKLTIQKGDTVRWRFDSLVHEDHTVSMPDPGVFFKLNFDEYMCDPDGDEGTAPDTRAEFTEQGEPFCPEGSVLEADVSHDFWGGQGNGVLSGPNDAEHSGIRGVQAEKVSPPAVGPESFDVRFGAASGRKPFKYFCFLHPMDATVAVN